MKKIIGIAAIAAMVATSAFAEITFGAWGRSGLDLFGIGTSGTKTEGTGSDTETWADTTYNTTATPSWASGSRVGFSVAGTSEDGNIGFNVNVDANGGSWGVGDQAKIWANLGFVKVQFGKIQLDDLRGSIGDWGNRDISWKGEDAVFTRFQPSLGATISMTPIEGLFVGAAIDTSSGSGTVETKAMLKAAQVGAGYTVKDVVQLKAQFIGNGTDNDDGKYQTGTLEFGADLLMIKNNLVEIGFKLPMAEDNANGYFNAIVSAKGSADKLAYKAQVYGDFAQGAKLITTTENEMVPTIGINFGAEYDLSSFTVGLTGGYNITFQSESKSGVDASLVTNALLGELYAKKGFGNGYIFAGVADSVSFAVGSLTYSGDTAKSTTTKNSFYIPVGAEYWF